MIYYNLDNLIVSYLFALLRFITFGPHCSKCHRQTLLVSKIFGDSHYRCVNGNCKDSKKIGGKYKTRSIFKHKRNHIIYKKQKTPLIVHLLVLLNIAKDGKLKDILPIQNILLVSP